jgi:hypothetical protein
MDEKIIQQILDELLSRFEPLDTQTEALLQLLKAKGIATDEELVPYLEQAGNASNVRWLAARVRIGALISSALKPPRAARRNRKLARSSEKPGGECRAENGRPEELRARGFNAKEF